MATLATFSPHASPPRSRCQTPHSPHSLDICNDNFNAEAEAGQPTPSETPSSDLRRALLACLPSRESSSPGHKEGNPLNSANRSVVSERALTSASNSFSNCGDPDLFDCRLLRESSQASPDRSTASTPRSCFLEPPSVLELPSDAALGLWKTELVESSWAAIKDRASLGQVGEQLGRSLLASPLDCGHTQSLVPGHELAELLDTSVSYVKQVSPTLAATQVREFGHSLPGHFVGRYPVRLIVDSIVRCLHIYLGEAVTVATIEAWKSFVCCMWGRREIG